MPDPAPETTSLESDPAEEEAVPPAEPLESEAGETERLRLRYGMWIILAGFFLVLVVVALVILNLTAPKNLTGIIGTVTSLVGTVVGAYLGVQVGAVGRKEAEAGRKRAEEKKDKIAKVAATLALAVPEDKVGSKTSGPRTGGGKRTPASRKRTSARVGGGRSRSGGGEPPPPGDMGPDLLAGW